MGRMIPPSGLRGDALPVEDGPVHRAEHLLLGKSTARILLGTETYILRLTRAGKLILTK